MFPGGYNIDPSEGEKNVCLVDSVGSQANRIETMFMPDKYKGKYAHLVPQVSVKAGEKSVSILEAGHRAGDALVRCTTLQKDLQDAFKAVLKGNAEPLARIAPTSLVFGVWDSRDTQAKLPRLIASTIRAFDVTALNAFRPRPILASTTQRKMYSAAKPGPRPIETVESLLQIAGSPCSPSASRRSWRGSPAAISPDATLSLAVLEVAPSPARG